MGLFDLPSWIDREAWDGFCDWRNVLHRQKKAPWTERAEKIVMNKLAKWHDEGYDCNHILDEAVLNGWRGLFVNDRTPRIGVQRGTTQRVTRADERLAESIRQSKTVFGTAGGLVEHLRPDLQGRPDGGTGCGLPQSTRTPLLETGTFRRSDNGSGETVTQIPTKRGTRI